MSSPAQGPGPQYYTGSICLFPSRGTPLYPGGGEKDQKKRQQMVLEGEERQQGATAGFFLQLFCSVQSRQGDIQVLCCCRHSGRAHRHDLIQVVSEPLIVSFARTNYFLGWHRNWYRLGIKSGWIRKNLVAIASLTSPNQTWISVSTDICGGKLCYSYSKI